MSAVLRMEIHRKAKDLMFKAEYRIAIPLLNEGIERYGIHIRLLCDLAFCYGVEDDVIRLNQTILKIEEEYLHCGELISDQTNFSVLFSLGKFYEEQALIHRALDYYEKSLRVSKKLEMKFSLLAHAQLLRLNSVFKNMTAVNEHYKQCFLIAPQMADWDAEVKHAVHLAEAQLFGRSFKLALNSEKFFSHPGDRNWFLYDLLELELLNSRGLIDFIQWQSLLPQPTGLFEVTLLEMAQKKFDYDLKFMAQMTFFSALRLMAIALNTEALATTELLEKFNLFVGTLNQNDAQMIQKLVSFAHVSAPLSYTNETQTLCYQNINLKLSSAIDQKIMNYLMKNEPAETTGLIKQVYDEDWSEETYEKLRVAIHRLNTKIFKQFGPVSKIKLTKTELLWDLKPQT